MANENEFLLHALLMGVFITFVYDTLRIFRRVIPHRDFWVSMEDLSFWVYCAGEVFLLMYHESDGTLRWFAVLGAMVGMLLYRKLVSPWLVAYSSLALRWILGWLVKLLGWVCKPGVFVCGKAKNGISRLAHRIGRRIKIRLTDFLKMLKMTLKTK